MFSLALDQIGSNTGVKGSRATWDGNTGPQKAPIHISLSALGRRSSSRFLATTETKQGPENFFKRHWTELEQHKLNADEVFLKKAWSNYDDDGNGTLDLEEVEQLCLDYMTAIPSMIQARQLTKHKVAWDTRVHKTALKTARRVFEMSDADNSGEIDFEEFCVAFYKIVGRSIEMKAGATIQDANEQESDEDGSGGEDALDCQEQSANDRLNRLLRSYNMSDVLQRTSPEVQEVMHKEAVDRSTSEVELVLQLMQHVGVWSKMNLPIEARRYAARHMYYSSVEAQGVICAQGQTVNKMFIILSGSAFSITKDSGGVIHKISSLKAGDTIGELELLKGVTFEGKVTSREFTEIAILDDRIFNQYLRPHHYRTLRKTISFLRSIPLFSRVQGNQFIELALNSRYRILPSNTVILQQGDLTENTDPVYFVSEGEVRVIQEIRVKNADAVLEQIGADRESIRRNKAHGESIFVEVAKMGPRNVFGELDHFRGRRRKDVPRKRRPTSVVTVARTVILEMNRSNFCDVVNVSMTDGVKPTSDGRKKTRRDYLTRLRFGKHWSDYKGKIRNLLRQPNKSARLTESLPAFESRTMKQRRELTKRKKTFSNVLPMIQRAMHE